MDQINKFTLVKLKALGKILGIKGISRISSKDKNVFIEEIVKELKKRGLENATEEEVFVHYRTVQDKKDRLDRKVSPVKSNRKLAPEKKLEQKSLEPRPVEKRVDLIDYLFGKRGVPEEDPNSVLERMKDDLNKLKRVRAEEKESEIVASYGNITEDDEYSQKMQIQKGDIKAEKSAVTPEIILRLIEDRKFLEGICDNLRRLYNEKNKRYAVIQDKLEVSIKEDEISAQGLPSYMIADKFPLLETNKILFRKISNIRSIAILKERTVTPEIVKENLLIALNHPSNGIASLSGKSRAFARNHLCRQIYILSRGHEVFLDTFSNLIFTGSPGVGKTKLAKTIGFVYKHIGILIQGDLIITSPVDLIASYVGQTAPKTTSILLKGFENIILIDEAYQIMNCADGKITGERNYGSESITEIVNFLDKYIGLSVMIVAGYKKEINGCFLAANPGLDRRFPLKWDLPSYESIELFRIFMNEVVKRLKKNIFDRDIAVFIYSFFKTSYQEDMSIFANQAGDAINLVGNFIENYYGNPDYIWGRSFEDKISIFSSAANDYLLAKGYQLSVG